MADPTFTVLAEGEPDVSVVASGKTVSGWQRVAITRTLEGCPNAFTVGYTEQSGLGEISIVEPGEPVLIQIGIDTVITGYADALEASLSPVSHELRLSGRGKCQDLVDCTSEWPSATIASTDVLDVATKLAAPYGIKVSLGEGAQVGSPTLPAFNVTITESPFVLIEEMARFYQLLAYEDVDGNLVLASVGTEVHASGLTEGVNVLAASVMGRMDQRFSDYVGYTTSTLLYSDVGDALTQLAKQSDPGVKRHRLRAMVVEAQMGGLDVGTRRLTWERTRRAGRALQLRVTVDSWRDKAGELWTPNRLAPLSLPSLHIDGVSWIISEVTYLRDPEQGTRAELLLMAADAYRPEPILLQALFPDLAQASGQ